MIDLLSPVEGYTLAEIKRAEEEDNKVEQSETTRKEEDNNGSEAKQSDMIEKDHVCLLIVHTSKIMFKISVDIRGIGPKEKRGN